MCQGTPADRCGLGTRRCSIPTRNKQLVHSETQTAAKQTILSTQVIIVEGHFYGILPNVSRSEPVFVAWCTPVAMPETRECVVQVADLTFCNPFLDPTNFLSILIFTFLFLHHSYVVFVLTCGFAGRD